MPHNLISTQESPFPLQKCQMAPRFKILMASVSKKGTQIYFPFRSFAGTFPGKRTPSRFPNRAPIQRGSVLQGTLHISQKPHLSGSPVKEPSLRSPSWNPSQRHAPPLQPFFIHLSKSPVYEIPAPTYQVPLRWKGAQWREMPVPGEFLNISSRVPCEGAPPEAPLNGASLERDTLPPEPPSSISQSPR